MILTLHQRVKEMLPAVYNYVYNASNYDGYHLAGEELREFNNFEFMQGNGANVIIMLTPKLSEEEKVTIAQLINDYNDAEGNDVIEDLSNYHNDELLFRYIMICTWDIEHQFP